MARLIRVLAAAGKAARRRSKHLRQLSGNNMFYAGVTLLFMMDPAGLGLFLLFMGLVLFLPSSADPMAAVPRERLALWPLARGERVALRLVSPLLNPITWVLLAGLVWRRVTWGLWAFVAPVFLVGFAGSGRTFPTVWNVKVPAGRFAELVSKDLRQFLTALDLYCALLVFGPTLYLRLDEQLPAEAGTPFTILVNIMMSTMAITLFGVDGRAGLERYRLLPVAGWTVLLCKGAAFLLLTLVVTAPLGPVAGLAGGMMSLAVGQWFSVRRCLPQYRWRFRASSPFGASLGQMVAGLAGIAAVVQLSTWWLLVCAAIYASSVAASGRALDAGTTHPGDA
ncbi:MAG: hypothetical protein FJW40_00125 [Acidobacteria bacterium]|nr:hypothetical protein [Acidobacteriota bacterium]